MARVLAWSVLAVVSGLWLASTASAAESGGISGTVTSAATKEPIAGIEVCAYSNVAPYARECAKADAEGKYTVTGLPANQYTVSFAVPYTSSLDYLTQYYNGKPSYTEAEPVSVTAGATTNGIDAAMVEGGQISGKVTAASTNAALAGIEVCASGGTFRCASTAADGSYTVSGLSAGEYRVDFTVPYRSELNYVSQYYDGKATYAEATPVAVTLGNNTSGIDAALREGGLLKGHVTASGTKAPIAGIEVCAIKVGEFLYRCATTDSEGSYTVAGLATGEYKVNFLSGGSDYLTQYYKGKATFESADTVTVTAGSTTSGIDAAMIKSGHVTGRITDNQTSAPLANIGVCAELRTLGAPFTRCATSGADGSYDITGLESGEYRVSFYDGTQKYITQYFHQRRTLSEADIVSVTAGGTAEKVDAAMVLGAVIKGEVTDATTMVPIAGITACALATSSGGESECATTNEAGEYTIRGLVSSTYDVAFNDSAANYVDQAYNNKPSLSGAQVLSLSPGEEVTGINAKLATGGRITGRVTDNTTGEPIAGALIYTLNLDGSYAGVFLASTNNLGEYARAVSVGEYHILFTAASHQSQSYNNEPWPNGTPDPVKVANNLTTPHIDAALLGPGPINTARPTISGTVAQGQTLTEHAGSWEGSPTKFSYQWLRCDSTGLNCAQINGATSQSYVLGGADGGRTIEVEETATNGNGSNRAVSLPTSVVPPLAPVSTAAPTITGVAEQGQTLTEHPGTWENNPTDFSYQWLRCDASGNGCLEIKSATAPTYVAVGADVGHALKVQEIAKNVGGSSAPAVSTPTAAVLPPKPVNETLPTITGTPSQGKTLTEHHGNWQNKPTEYKYQWLQCDSLGNTCFYIPEATQQTYIPTAFDVEHTLRVAETAINAAGSSEPALSVATAAVTTAAPVNNSPPKIVGVARPGETLVVSRGSWSNEPTRIGEQWLRCDASGATCASIAGEVESSYLVSADDLGHTLRVEEAASNEGGNGVPARSLPTAKVASGTLQAVAGEDLETTVGTSVTFDGSGSTPASEITGAHWNFGDGAEGGGAIAQHSYKAIGHYTATLTVERDSETSQQSISVTVIHPEHQVAVTVEDESHQPLSGAEVLYIGANNVRIDAATNGAGEAYLAGLPDGTHTVYAVKLPGYQPAVGQVNVSGGSGEATITLKRGELGEAKLEAHEMTKKEIEEAGINVNDPANQDVYSFEVALHFKCQINGAGEFVGLERCTGGGGGGGGGGWTSHGICKEGTCISGGAVDERPFIKELKLQGTVTSLKQFFAVKLVVYNLSPKQFAFTHGQATLNVPAGMSLAPTPVPQTATQSVADIPGEGSAVSNWIIRGDQPGEYFLSASYHGQLEPFEKPFELLASSTEPLKVWGAEAFGFHVQADEGSLKEGVPYHVRIGIYDKAPIPFYNVAISLSEAHEHFIFQPNQQFTAQVGELKPGETVYAPQDILVPDANGGTFDPSQSYARFVGEAAHPGEGIEAVSPPPLYSMSASLESITLVHLHWQPSPGAEGYEVFSTPNLDTPFSPDPDAVQTSPTSKATVTRLPASATDAWIPRGANDPPRFYAVSSIIGGQLRLEHPVKEPALQGPVGGPLTLRELLAGGHNLAEFCVDCFMSGHVGFAQPVDAPTGNFWHSFRDLSVPGRGIPLNLSRTYNSGAASTNGPFGYGWSFSYGMSLSFPDATHVVVNQENGATVEFSEEAGGKWVAPPRVTASLVHNGDGSWTFVRRKRETFTFDSTGRLTRETDLNGYASTLSYNENGELKTVTDPAGRKLKFAWKKGHVVSVADPLKRVVGYEYDSAGNLSDVVDVAGGDTHFTYDAQHLMLSMRMPNQAPGVSGSTEAALHNTYDEQGRVTAQADPLGRKTTFEYAGEPLGEAGGTTTVTDPKGNKIQQTYQFGLLMSETRGYGTPEAATWKFAYNPETLGVTSITDPNGHVTKSTFDSEGNVLTSEDALGHKTVSTYDSLNDLLTTTDPLGVTTTRTYDGHGNLLSQSRPLVGTSQVQVTKYTYGDASHPGDVTAMTDPDGRVWRYTYDGYGDQNSSTDPLNDRASSTYNIDGWKLTEVSPRGNASGKPAEYTTSYAYNTFGQVAKTVDPLGHATFSEYDLDQNLVASTDAAGNVTHYGYDADDGRISEHRANGSTTETTYWPDGSVKEQIDAAGHATSYGYDALGRRTTATDPLGRTTHYSYDTAGNETALTDPEGQVTTMTYDAANQRTSISYSDGKTPNVTGITYDADGQRTGQTDGTGTWSWHWDSLHRLASVTEGNSGTVSYGYDLRGLATEIAYPNGKTISRTYDAAGRLASVTDWKKDTTTFAYDADGNETRQTAAGIIDSFSFDRSGAMAETADKAGATTLFGAKYARNANSQLTSDSSAATGHGSYGYTALNQLCYAGGSPSEPCTKPPAGASPFAYDSADNLTQNGSTHQEFDAANQLCWSAPGSPSGSCGSPPSGATTYSYNAHGDRTAVTPSTGPGTSLSYDQADRITHYAQGSTAATYAYNGDGLRMNKTVGKAPTAFTWDLSEELPLLLQAGKTSYIYGPEGLPLEQITGSKPQWLHHDQIGSTRLITSSTGSNLGAYTYTPWGALASHTGTATTNLGFDGQYTDAETGYQYLRARYYDPATGQFLSLDPAVTITGRPYGYAAGDPLDQSDPLGLINWWHVAKDVGTGLDALAVAACVTAAATTAELASPACAALAYAGGVVGGGTALHDCLTRDKSCKGDVVCAVGSEAVPGKPAQTSLSLLCDLAPDDTSPAQRNPYCPNGYIDPKTGTYDPHKLQNGPLNLKQNGLPR